MLRRCGCATDMDLPDLLIIRHGETEWNRSGIMQGHGDSALTQKGRQQAQSLNALLATAELTDQHRAWCSPLGRARETADIALAGHFTTWTEDARLKEINVGEFEGMTFEDAIQSDPRFVDLPGPVGWQFHAPGGESYAEFHRRIASWLAELQAPAVVVTHGITSRVMRAIALGLEFNDLGNLPGGQGIIHRVRNRVADIVGP